MSKLRFAIIRDPQEAQAVWDYLSPHTSLDDEWEFRYAFTKYLHYTLHFIVGYDGDQAVGLLPLQYNSAYGLLPPYAPRINGFLEFFGGDDIDSNDIFLKPGYESYKNFFLAQIDRPAVLAPVSNDLYSPSREIYSYKYVLPLGGYQNYEEYLQDKLSSGTRQNIRRQIRHLYSDYTIEVKEGSKEDLERLFELSLMRFGNNSSFRFDYRKQMFRDLYDSFDSSVFVLRINGREEAVAFDIFYDGVFSDINAVANPNIPNLGKLLTLLQIDKAIQSGASSFDAGKGDSGWKEAFHFTRIPQYKIDLTFTEEITSQSSFYTP